MGVLKSQSQDQLVLVLFEKLFADLQQRWPDLSKSLSRDLETLRSRVSCEGLSFCTKTLPSLGKAFDLALDSGSLKPPAAFKKAKGSQTIPAFLQGMFRILFDSSGNLVGGSASAVADIRQVLYLVYKLELPYRPSDETRVIESFLETEESIANFDFDSVVLTTERSLVSEILEGFDPLDVVPKHGPGAVATGERLEKKWTFGRLYSGIHQVYPYYKYFVVGGAHELIDRIKWYRSLTRLETGEAKVVLVPKDSRGPRLISCEPLEYQWIQQGVNRELVRHLESHRLTKGHINFQDQSVNQELALESSKHHFYSTIDLKDASDRVSVTLVNKLFPERVARCLMAVRSGSTKLPDGRSITLRKFAPMGSAVCFSVEALIFWVISIVAVARRLTWTYREAAQHVYVYGDDIIVPTIAFDAVVSALESVCLKVNESKCCSRGDFRESCGVDAYQGVNVTPTRISTLWSDEPSSGSCLSSYSSYANSFAEKGYYGLASELRSHLARVQGACASGTHDCGFPCTEVHSVRVAAIANAVAGYKTRWNHDLQRYESRVKVLVPKRTPSTLVSWPRLLRNMCSGSGERPDEVVHSRSTKVVWRWRAL